MRRRNIVACTLVAFATFGAGSAQAARPFHLSRAEQTLLVAINSARAAAGVPPLRATPALTNAATWQSQVLAQAGILDHTSPDGSTLIDRLTRVRWHGTAAGEDLATARISCGHPSARSASAWRVASGAAALRSSSQLISVPDRAAGRSSPV
jgi:uncharacterized protein YkwD